MNLIKYVKKFGKFTFLEKEFNDVDATICIMLSYMNFDYYLPLLSEDKDASIFIKDVKNEDVKILCSKELVTIDNIKLLKVLKKAPRFKDIKVKYMQNTYDTINTIQFFAITLFIPNVLPMIVIRGTDMTMIGWKENFLGVFNKIIPSHVESYNYLDFVSKEIDGDFMIGGHSKGGNITLFTAIKAPLRIQNRIKMVYSLDGQGFQDKTILKCDGYNRIENRIVQIFPNDDVVGTFFYTPQVFKIIKSKGFGVIQHSPFLWMVNKGGGSFVEMPNKRPLASKIRHRTFKNAIARIGEENILDFFDTIAYFVGGTNSSLSYFFRDFLRYFKNGLRFLLRLDKNKRKRNREVIKILKEEHKKSVKYYKEKKKRGELD